jgi:hypothetical protein
MKKKWAAKETPSMFKLKAGRRSILLQGSDSLIVEEEEDVGTHTACALDLPVQVRLFESSQPS